VIYKAPQYSNATPTVNEFQSSTEKAMKEILFLGLLNILLAGTSFASEMDRAPDEAKPMSTGIITSSIRREDGCDAGETNDNSSYAVIISTFCHHQPKFQMSYRRLLREDPALEGTVTLSLSISAAGNVEKASIIRPNKSMQNLERRVLLIASRIPFGKLKNGPWQGEFTLRFHPS